MTIYRRPKQMKLKENLYANMGEFFYGDGTSFEGYYHMFDLKKKKYFEGSIYSYKAKEIFPDQKLEFSENLNREYTNIWRNQGDKTLEIKRISEPDTIIPTITSKDLDKGEITRHLLLQRNSLMVYEIDELQFKNYKKGANPYNSNYKVAKTPWYITGPIFSLYGSSGAEITKGLYEKNYQQAQIVLDEVPELFPILQDLLQYTFPNPETDLYSDGSYLYLPDGQRYIGRYHVHPTKGPMAGSRHGSAKHPALKALL
tara:strand:+ start:5444 stop:6214 length:771 start_codon:yes stop_codon:yes gene_type:complete